MNVNILVKGNTPTAWGQNAAQIDGEGDPSSPAMFFAFESFLAIINFSSPGAFSSYSMWSPPCPIFQDHHVPSAELLRVLHNTVESLYRPMCRRKKLGGRVIRNGFSLNATAPCEMKVTTLQNTVHYSTINEISKQARSSFVLHVCRAGSDSSNHGTT